MKPFFPRKRFGQHFLRDKQIIQQLVEVIDPRPGQTLVEIGPGQGALTFPVLAKIGRLDVVELDRDLIPLLKKKSEGKGELIIHQADALEFDFASLKKNTLLRVIGNLPYNISTPLIFHLLQQAQCIQDMHFLLQKEVVERLTANPGTHAYGRLSVMVQYHCEAFELFDVSALAFDPPPKVESSVVRLIPFHEKILQAEDYQHFANVVKQAFGQRRKTLRNALKKIITDAEWEQLSISPTSRPEELSVKDYLEISHVNLRHR